MNDKLSHISVIDPIGPAIERVKQVLFRPFDIGKWFAIGFCAWLAGLCQRGTSAPSFNFGYEKHKDISIHRAYEYLAQNLHWIIPLGLTILLLALALGALLLWLSSRGKFMFLHCIAANEAKIVAPWKKYKNPANSLFVFSFIAGIISFLIFMILAAFALILFLPLINAGDEALFALIPFLLIFILTAVIVGIAFWLFWTVIDDFIVTIQYLRFCRTGEAFKQFFEILSAKKGTFALYFLFVLLINFVLGFLVSIAVLIACCFCCLGLLFAIPYIGTVLLLPVLVFRRAYSLYFLRQFGPDFDVFESETAVTLPEG